jgi:hypothetical protein
VDHSALCFVLPLTAARLCPAVSVVVLALSVVSGTLRGNYSPSGHLTEKEKGLRT